MSKLVRAGLRRLFRYRLYDIGLFVCALLPVWAAVIRCLDMQRHPEIYESADASYRTMDILAFSSLAMMVFVVMVVVSALFLGTEYSDGTIRNKLVAGHRRLDIYLANYLVCAAANLSMLYMNYLSSFTIAKLIVKGSYMTLRQIFLSMLCESLSVLSFTAFIVIISMLIQSKAGAAVTALLFTMALFITALSINNSLSQPEYRTVYDGAFTDDLTEEVQVIYRQELNPNYVGGVKRKVYEQLEIANPVGYAVSGWEYGSYGLMELYDALIILALGGVGIVCFRKKDLK